MDIDLHASTLEPALESIIMIYRPELTYQYNDKAAHNIWGYSIQMLAQNMLDVNEIPFRLVVLVSCRTSTYRLVLVQN